MENKILNQNTSPNEISQALEFYRKYKDMYSFSDAHPNTSSNTFDNTPLEEMNEQWQKAQDILIKNRDNLSKDDLLVLNNLVIPSNKEEQNLIRQLDKQQKNNDNILEAMVTNNNYIHNNDSSNNYTNDYNEEVNNIIATSLKDTIPTNNISTNNNASTNTSNNHTLNHSSNKKSKKKNKDSGNGQQISIETSSGPIILDRHNPAYSQFTVGKDGKVNLNGKKRIILDGKTLQNNHLMENMVLEDGKYDYNNIKYSSQYSSSENKPIENNIDESEIEYNHSKLSPNVSKENKDYVHMDIKKQYPYGEPAMQLHGKTKVEGNYDMTYDWENFCTKFGDNIIPDYEYEMPVDLKPPKNNSKDTSKNNSSNGPKIDNINRSKLTIFGNGEKEYNGQFNNGQAIEIGLIKNPHNVVVPTKYNPDAQNMPRTVAEWEMQKEMRMENDMSNSEMDKKYIDEQLPTTNVPPDAIKEAKESGSQTASIALSTKLRDLKTVVTEFAKNVNKIDRNLSDEMNLCIYRMLRGAAKIKRRTHHKSTIYDLDADAEYFRDLVKIAVKLQYLSPKKGLYNRLTSQIDEIGRIIGGFVKNLSKYKSN